MKPAFPDLVGNLSLKNRLCDDIRNGKLSHAYIIEGAPGSGKHLLAKEIAAAISCEAKETDGQPLPCGTCLTCKKIFSGNSPDVIYINRGDKATLGVDAIRGIRQDVLIAPNDVDTKIYVIEDAHLLTVQAQNALLLTLEEPPQYVLFLLLCETASSLLETVRSRAPILRTEPLPTEEIGAYLLAHSDEARSLRSSEPQAFSEILSAANHTIGQALNLLSRKERNPLLQKREQARKLISLIAENASAEAVLSYLSGLGQKREEVVEQFRTTALCLRDLLAVKQTDRAELCFFPDYEEASALAYEISLPTLMKLLDQVNDLTERLRMNANLRLALTAFAVNVGLLR